MLINVVFRLLQVMYVYKGLLHYFTFSLISVDFDSLEAKHQVDIDEMELNKFMEVHTFDQIPSKMAGVVTYFDLDDDVRSMAEILHTYKDSYIFKICWESQAKDFAREANSDCESDDDDEEDLWATLDSISEDIFQPCYSKYRKIYESLKNGSMTFEEVDLIFKAYIGKYEELAEDATIMSKLDPADDKRWIQRRIQQIEQYHELHLAVESAQVVMMVKQTLGLQGDFQVLEKLLIVVSQKISVIYIPVKVNLLFPVVPCWLSIKTLLTFVLALPYSRRTWTSRRSLLIVLTMS